MFYDPKKPPPVRLPGDEGPNPWDSSTPYQPPAWLGWKWWLQIIALGAGLVLARYLLNGG